jgi:hypothetical protein
MLPFGVTIPATVPQGSEIPEGLTNNPVYFLSYRAHFFLQKEMFQTKVVEKMKTHFMFNNPFF